MTVQMMQGYLEAEMRRHGFPCLVKNGYTTLTAGLGGKRWRMALACGEDRFTCYAAYPWPLPGGYRAKVLEWLNEINAGASFGSCFLLETGLSCLIVFRCDIIVADEYSIAECFENGLKYTSAALCSHWETLNKFIMHNA